MIQGRYIQSDGKNTVNFRNAENHDIIHVLHSNIHRATKQVKDIAPYFSGPSVLKTCRNIFVFLKEKIRYKADGYNQDIRLPGRFLASATGDCKSYSLFTASVLSQLGIPYVIRYASYTSDPTPSHVYVVATPRNSLPIVIDAVYGKFNQEKPYTFKQDYTMNVRTLSGIGNAQDPNPFIGNIVKTGALAAPRGAYLLLVKFNVFGFASYLGKVLDKDPVGLKKRWNNLGGNFTELKNAIASGRNRPAIFNKNARINGIGIGAEPVTTGVTLASAAAIIAQLADVLAAGKKLFGNIPLPGQGGNQQPPLPPPPAPAANTTTPLLIGMAALAAILIFK